MVLTVTSLKYSCFYYDRRDEKVQLIILVIKFSLYLSCVILLALKKFVY